jgi:hypothetical protein
MNDSGVVTTSSPGEIPASLTQRCRPAVPLDSAAAKGTSTRSASAASNCSIIGPNARRPERMTSRTSSSSASSTYGAESPIVGNAVEPLTRGRILPEPASTGPL